MMKIMTAEEWKRRTYNRANFRGIKLKGVDSALQRLHDLGLRDDSREIRLALRGIAIKEVNEAFEHWMRSQNHFRGGRRDKNDAVTDLVKQLSANRHLSRSEQMAIQEIKRHRDSSLNLLLADCKVVSRGTLRNSNLRKKMDAYAVTTAPPIVMKTVFDLIKLAFGESKEAVEDSGLMGDLMGLISEKLASAMAEWLPLAGTAIAGCKLVWASGKAIQKTSQRHSLVDFHRQLPDSEARAAIMAMETLFSREISACKRTIVRSGASLGAGIGNALTAGGLSGLSAGVTLSTTLASLMDHLFMSGRDYQEAKEATQFIAKGRLDKQALAKCPLLGAYYVTEAPTSNLALYFVKIGGPAWLDDVERLKKRDLNGVVSKAKRLISDSRHVLVSPNGVLRGNV